MLIQKHQLNWVSKFNKLKKILESNISVENLRIEHIGSTAVKKLAAKPIIDIDIVYEIQESFEKIKSDLAKLGYYHNGDQGIAGREAFKRQERGDHYEILDDIVHHLYVCHINNEELNRHLAFRDYLRENVEARKAYENLKYQIAAKANQDRKEYAQLKEEEARDFVELIISKSKK